MPRDRDPFWDHVEEVDDRWKCKYCDQSFSLKVSVSRIKLHLSGVSGQGVEVCTNPPAEVQIKAYEAIRNKRYKAMPVVVYDQGQASESMVPDTPMHEQLEILNRMTTNMFEQPQAPENLLVQEHMYDVPEIPLVLPVNDASKTSGEKTAGQMQPELPMPRLSNIFQTMDSAYAEPSTSSTRMQNIFAAEDENAEGAEDLRDEGMEEMIQTFFNVEPSLQSLTLEDQVPHARQSSMVLSEIIIRRKRGNELKLTGSIKTGFKILMGTGGGECGTIPGAKNILHIFVILFVSRN
ncbi:hypothetical protein Tsubulata_030875 [Turnera subulata]|uniref:BED-type domain-containing protein n=1 Tax=Turnera subulata TaxID=218843 RepID=A0A9Q0J4P1_9ROSI|nr:hypothetical protein Tsubulata_030875 [Turnera subulata]